MENKKKRKGAPPKGHPKWGGRQKRTPEELYQDIKDAIDKIEKEKRRAVSIAAITEHIGMHYASFYKYYRKDEKYKQVIEWMECYIEARMIDYGIFEKGSLPFAYLKNNCGWKDDRSLHLGGLKEAPPINLNINMADFNDIMSHGTGDMEDEEFAGE